MRDLPVLALMVLFGGVIAPVLLLYGLARVPAASAALLLTSRVSQRWCWPGRCSTNMWIAGCCWARPRSCWARPCCPWPGGSLRGGAGALAVAAACVAWAVDNNLTRKLSSADPVQIALIKGLTAGSVNLSIALLRGVAFPPGMTLAAVGLVGFLGYGASLTMFVLALRHLGAARTGAYFSTPRSSER